MLYVLSQIICVAGALVDLVSRGMKNKKTILLLMVIAYIMCVLAYLLIASWTAALLNAFNLVRSIIYMFLDERKAPFRAYLPTIIVFLAATVAVVALCWTDPFDLFILFANVVVAIGLALKNMFVVRTSLAANEVLWLVYNTKIKMYVGIVANAAKFIFCVGVIVAYAIKEKKARPKDPEESAAAATDRENIR